MGQKINAIGFRLGKRTNWPSVWCNTQKQYAAELFSDLELRHFNKKLIRRLGFYENDSIVKKSQGKTKFYTKLLTTEDIVGGKEKINTKRSFSPFFDNYLFEYKKFKNSSLKIARSSSQKNMNILPFLSAQTLSDYIVEQLKLSHRSKHWSFKISLQSGIADIISKLLRKKNTHFISGVRILCSGKWRKTKSGRKQRIVFSIGRLRSPSMDCVSSYGFSTQATKFGACGIKVWISYKPFFQKANA